MAMASYGAYILAILSLFSTVLARDYCVYTIFVKTGYMPQAGTDSHISAEFFDAAGNTYKISNITEWGGSLMASNHDCFERNNLDLFTGIGECLDSPICGLHLTSDGSGDHHGWYCDYLEVTSACSMEHVPCSTHRFTVQQWLANDVYPYQLVAHRDDCPHMKHSSSRKTWA
ncbi:hypothetical protein MPTK1_5g19865 [Marchantia polymorpha subsp. ruderalis]|uniref:Uncharacterized protein n=3 Tax=Marchantia polymorpha TaxID=3197 RepID=A0A176VJA5_MARPO|nr:hypothetical protein AXG93_4905s1420 [Marchantia polymorpha subsp. ruderalis]PTQ29839.1 hypothetical protein MARPO_0134s0047 [Marchantia polymorpha]BBN20698.1 hypothetical protein Mp_zg00290 [Marchantia polymorpha subsp. ruderalis]|eukprot:PTQ29839.1 hypothetical protein MARPO_0134s0047 [Marchantia polymorpha]